MDVVVDKVAFFVFYHSFHHFTQPLSRPIHTAPTRRSCVSVSRHLFPPSAVAPLSAECVSVMAAATCICVAESSAAVKLYGVVYPLICFKDSKLSPCAAQWLRAFPRQTTPTAPFHVYVVGVVGVARCGKSHTQALLAQVLLEQGVARRPTLLADLAALGQPIHEGRFEESFRSVPCTLSVQAMTLPHVSESTHEVDGAYLLIDAEGQNLGDTTTHLAILGIVSRVVSVLVSMEATSYSHRIIESLGLLLASQIVSGAGVSWPSLIQCINKYDAGPLEPTPAEYWRLQIQDQPGDPTRNQARQAIRTHFPDSTLVTISRDSKLGQWNQSNIRRAAANPPQPPLPQPALSECDEWYRDEVKQYTDLVISRAEAHPLSMDAQLLATYLSSLITAYRGVGYIPPDTFTSMANQVCATAVEACKQYYGQHIGDAACRLSEPCLLQDSRGTSKDDYSARFGAIDRAVTALLDVVDREVWQPAVLSLTTVDKSAYVTQLNDFFNNGKEAAKTYHRWCMTLQSSRAETENRHDGGEYEQFSHHRKWNVFKAAFVERWDCDDWFVNKQNWLSVIRNVDTLNNGDVHWGTWQDTGAKWTTEVRGFSRNGRTWC